MQVLGASVSLSWSLQWWAVTGTAQSSVVQLQPRPWGSQEALGSGDSRQTPKPSLAPRICLLHPLSTLSHRPDGRPGPGGASHLAPCSSPCTGGQEPGRGCKELAEEAVGLNLQHGNVFIYRHPDKQEPIHQAPGTSRANEILLPSPYFQHCGLLLKHACVKEGL